MSKIHLKHQTVHNWRQGLPIIAMFNGASQINKSLTLHFRVIQ